MNVIINVMNIYELGDNVWSRVFQFVDEKTHILSLPLN